MMVEIEKTESLLSQLLERFCAIGFGFLGILARFATNHRVNTPSFFNH
jgi:hypothetical protein